MARSKQAWRADRHGGGFTLVELLLALAISAVVMGAVPAIISLSARTAPGDAGIQTASGEAADLFAQLQADLRLARAVHAVSATSITLVVPERDGGPGTESVTYAWGGSPGDPVTVQVGAGSPLTVVEAAQSLAFTAASENRTIYQQASISRSTGRRYQEAKNSKRERTIPGNGAIVQYLTPTLEAGATAWRIERLEVELGCSAPITGESVIVEVRNINPDKSLGSTVHLRASVPSRDLGSSPSTQKLYFGPTWLPTDQTLGVVVRVSSSSLVATVVESTIDGGYTGGAMYAGASLTGPWLTTVGYALYHYVEGGAIVPGGGASAQSTLTRLDVHLTTGEGPWEFAASIYPSSPAAMP